MKNFHIFCLLLLLFVLLPTRAISFFPSKKNPPSHSSKDEINKKKQSKENVTTNKFHLQQSNNNRLNRSIANNRKNNNNNHKSDSQFRYIKLSTHIEKTKVPSSLSFITQNRVLPKPFYHPDKSFLIQFLPPSSFSIYSTPKTSVTHLANSKSLSLVSIRNKQKKVQDYIDRIEKKFNTKVLSINLEDSPELFQFITNFSLNYFNNYPIFYNRKSGSILYGDFTFDHFNNFVEGNWNHASSYDDVNMDEEDTQDTGIKNSKVKNKKIYSSLNLDSRREFDFFDKIEEKLINASLKSDNTNKLLSRSNNKGFFSNLFRSNQRQTTNSLSFDPNLSNYDIYIPKKYRRE